MSLPGGPEMFMILAVLLLLFGASRLPKLARSMGQAGKEFKEGFKVGATDDEPSFEGDCPHCGTKVMSTAKFCPGCAKPVAELVAMTQAKPLAAEG